LYSTSPHKPGSAEDFTYRWVESAQERQDPNAGEATAAVASGLAYVLTAAFRIPGLLFRALRRILVYGTLTRWTVTAALIASCFGIILSFLMNDEIMRAQVRIVPLGAIIGFALGVVRIVFLPRQARNS
jgi:hypothetical protein